jgi:hypothetical protein
LAVSRLLEPHVPFWPLGLSITTPPGRVSKNEISLSDPLAFGLVIVNDSAVVPPTGIVAGVNALVIVGGLVAATEVAGIIARRVIAAAATIAIVRAVDPPGA